MKNDCIGEGSLFETVYIAKKKLNEEVEDFLEDLLKLNDTQKQSLYKKIIELADESNSALWHKLQMEKRLGGYI